MRILINKLLVLAMCVLMCVCCISPALAAPASDYAILNVCYQPGQNPEAGVEYRVYQLAAADGDTCVLTEQFRDLAIDPNDAELFTTSSYQDLLQKTDAYIRVNDIKADKVATTGADGVAVFTQLGDGIWYAVTDKTSTIGDKIYTPTPFAVRIPYVTTENACVVENNLISAFVKFSVETVPPVPTPGPTPTPTPVGPKLPQTGLLWWPVPILAGLGLILVVVGAIWKKRSEDA